MLLTAKGRGALRDLSVKPTVYFYCGLILHTGGTQRSQEWCEEGYRDGHRIRAEVQLVKGLLKEYRSDSRKPNCSTSKIFSDELFLPATLHRPQTAPRMVYKLHDVKPFKC